jgi:hypothetical protein
MPDRELIHANEDTTSVLNLAVELGLTIRLDLPTLTPTPDILCIERLKDFQSGIFILYRPEWIFGDQQFIEISDGYNVGKYSQSPRINSSSITLYLSGERLENDKLRLGSGFISWSKTWLRQSDGTVHKAPHEVDLIYKELLKLIETRKSLKGGGHTYTVFEIAWGKLMAGSASPPFNYLDWPQNTR